MKKNDTLGWMFKSILACFLLSMLSTARGQIFSPSNIKIVWKDSNDVPYLLFKNVQKAYPQTVFMINGGKSTKAHHPIGLYIERGKKLSNIHSITNPKTNMELTPFGVFVINKGKAFISTSLNQSDYKDVDYALQANPILVWEGKSNKQLPKGRTIMRNGVGIKKDGSVYFASLKMGYREFAKHFLEEGCISALHLSDQKAETWQKDSKPSYGRYAAIIVVE